VNGRLREAQALESIGEKNDAIDAYRDILKEFPGVPLAERARRGSTRSVLRRAKSGKWTPKAGRPT
jgi:hypothetical protein